MQSSAVKPKALRRGERGGRGGLRTTSRGEPGRTTAFGWGDHEAVFCGDGFGWAVRQRGLEPKLGQDLLDDLGLLDEEEGPRWATTPRTQPRISLTGAFVMRTSPRIRSRRIPNLPTEIRQVIPERRPVPFSLKGTYSSVRRMRPGLIASPLLAQSRIQRIAQPVPEQIEADHHDHDGQAGDSGHMRRHDKVAPGVTEHGAPLRCGRLDAKT
jgi:hypothetical protein